VKFALARQHHKHCWADGREHTLSARRVGAKGGLGVLATVGERVRAFVTVAGERGQGA